MSLHDDDEDFPGLLEIGVSWEIILCNAARYASAEVVSYLIKELGLEALVRHLREKTSFNTRWKIQTVGGCETF